MRDAEGKYRIALIAAFVLFIVVFFSMVGCGSKYTEPFNDAPRGDTNDAPADLITFPDGFSNVATKCVDGTRFSVIYHADAPYGALSVVADDPSCTQEE